MVKLCNDRPFNLLIRSLLDTEKHSNVLVDLREWIQEMCEISKVIHTA